MEQAKQAAAGERALQRTAGVAAADEGATGGTGERGRDGLAHGGAREVGEDAVGETLELQLARADEADQRVLCPAEGIRERSLGGGRGVVALGHVVL
jgi:hypothetical protein